MHPDMKKTIATCLFVCALLASTSVTALPIGRSNDHANYMFGKGSPDVFVVGIYGSDLSRDVNDDMGWTRELETSRVMVYGGLDVFPWFTLFGAAGAARHTIGVSDADTSPEFEFGAVLNVLDQVIYDPQLFEDRLRVNAAATYTLSSATWYEDWDASWNTLKFSLIASVVNDSEGEKMFAPESVVLFAGPVYSLINGDDFDQDQAFGVTGGIEVYFTDSVSMNIALEHYDTTGLSGGLHLRF